MTESLHRALVFGLLSLCSTLIESRALFAQSAAVSAKLDFEQAVAPVLIRRCLECHQVANPSGNLSLQTNDGLMKGGDTGPVVIQGKADESELLRRVDAGEMPPLKHGESQKLPAGEIEVLRQWVQAGAEFPAGRSLDLYEQTSEVRGGRDWWSFQPVRNTVASVDTRNEASIPSVDHFIGRTLQEHGMTPAPPASPEVLVRRLYWDVVGLPAPADVVRQFVTDYAQAPSRNEVVERLIDRLLDSPQFGERWARHWLDVVRFAETCGYERDQVKPFAWKYRDWVVNAFNSDMPYDQFIREQLAGDEIPNRTEQSVIATGFLCLGTWNDEPNDPEDYKYERLEDLVHTTSTAFLGLTTKCARCHDHKFDPIPQTDYYRMAAAFWPGPIEPRTRDLIGGPSAEELGVTNVLGWTDITRTPAPLHKLRNGERHHPLEAVSAAALTCVPAEFRDFSSAPETARTSGLRLQLADWIASPRNPLTARVVVNRLWQHHFGEGLVRSTNNFGYTGDKPTHPELLDWLAAELVRNQGSLKHIHRLILKSETWQQASLHPRQEEYNQKDSANRFLWRAHRRRMEAESLRDAFLAATGELKTELGGPSFYPTISPDALEGLSRKASAWNASPEAEQHRRSLYIFTQRSLLPPMMTTFDMCDSTLPCGQRDVTIVAPQALTLLNNEFVHRRAEALAASIQADDNSVLSPEAAAERLWLAVLNRRPSEDEVRLAVEHLKKQAQRFTEDQQQETAAPRNSDRPESAELISSAALNLDAAVGVTVNADGRVEQWDNQNSAAHAASQLELQRRPILVQKAVNDQPALRFDGKASFLHVAGSLLTHDETTVFAVVTDAGTGGHRELLSNWSGADGNSGTSFFVGMTNTDAIRLSDALSGVGQIHDRQNPFLLTATNGAAGAAVYQQQRAVIKQSQPLPTRRLDTPWVIGQQGNIDGEYWHGDLACLLVFDRQLSTAERDSVQTYLMTRYELPSEPAVSAPKKSPEQLALASLCLVLFNSNEFAYID